MSSTGQPLPWPLLALGPEKTGKPKLQVAMLVFPGMTMLDLVGPQTVLCGPADTHLVARSREPFLTDTGIMMHPTATFDEIPADIDVLFVPGGPGQVDVVQDDETLAFLADRGSRARYVTSVCTGSLMLGAAGLLQGYKATTHWAARPLLSMFGAEPVDERVVVDRNRITGGGVTAGIDFGLVLLAEIMGDDVARTTQLLMEYDPAPFSDFGNPVNADEETIERAMEVLAPAASGMMAALEAWQNTGKYLPQE